MNQKQQELSTLARYCVTKSPGFAAIALWVPYLALEKAPYVAATNGARVMVGPRFWDYAPRERAYILCHEILHVALRHVPRGKPAQRISREHGLIWNVACDAIINRALDAMSWLQRPSDAVTFEKILPPEVLSSRPPATWSAEALYHQLLEQIGLPADGQGMDEWMEAWLKKNGIEGFDLIPGDGSGISDDLSEEIAGRIWASRLARAAAGDRPGGLLRELTSDFPAPHTPWPQLLRAFLQDAVMPQSRANWSRPARRVLATGSEIFEPATQPETGLRRAGIVVDTSGSIDDQILKRFAAEIEAVQSRTGCEILLLSADAEVQSEMLVKNDGKPFLDKVRSGQVTFKGGGGTDFEPAIKRLNESGVKVGIYLTDLMGNFGTERPKMPILWCSTSPHLEAPYGRTVYLDPLDSVTR